MRSRRVLVVDDHPINRRLFELWLVRQGFAVDVAVNGQQALDCIGSGTLSERECLDAGMDAYLLKPVNFAVLQTLIERLQPLARG